MANLMAFKETMKYLKVSRATLYRFVQARKIPAFKVGGRWRVDKDHLDRWLLEHENFATGALGKIEGAIDSHLDTKDYAKAKFFTLRQLGMYLKLSKQGVYHLVRIGHIPAAKINGIWQVRKKQCDDWLQKKENLPR